MTSFEAAAERYGRRAGLLNQILYVVHLAIFSLVLFWVSREWGLLGGLLAAAPVLVVFGPRLLAIEREATYCTERDPATVRDQFRSLDNPLAAWLLAYGEEVGTWETDDGPVAAIRVRAFGLFTTDYEVRVGDSRQGAIYRMVDDDGEQVYAVRVTVTSADDGTEVTVRAERRKPARPRQAAVALATLRDECRIWEAAGYEPVSRTIDLGFWYG